MFIHGPGGTGKTYMLKEYIRSYPDISKIVALSPTGIAALNISMSEINFYGHTIHRWAGLGLARESAEDLYIKVANNKRVLKRLLKTDTIIIDEISMVGGSLFDKLDYILRMVRKCSTPFGGIELIVCGDMLQLPPVNDEWVFTSTAWNNWMKQCAVKIVKLTEPKRYTDIEYFTILNEIRVGILTKHTIERLQSRVTAYAEYISKEIPIDTVKPTTLFSLKKNVEEYNLSELDKLPGEEICFLAKDKVIRGRISNMEDIMSTLAPTEIRLKVGAQVMLTRNMDYDSILVNGSRGVVEAIEPRAVVVKFLYTTVRITPATFSFDFDNIKCIRYQIPLILAWSLTIHKVQSCTLDYAICDIGSTVFAPGQAYVALSRVRSLDGLLLSNFDIKSIRVNKKARDYVNTL